MHSSVLSYQIHGIRCQGCIGQIRKTLEPVMGSNFKLDLSSQALEIDGLNEGLLPEIESRIQKLGFQLIPQNESAVKSLTYQSQKIQMKRLAVAAACTGNIMMFAVPVYSGLVGELKNAFLWITFLLFLPVLFYSAQPFFKGGLATIKSRSINIDFLMSVAIILTSSLSFYHLLIGQDDVYFDSTSGFIFLILVTRYMMDKTRVELLRPVFINELLPAQGFLNEAGEILQSEMIKAGDMILLQPKQILAFDAQCAQATTFDSSFIDGESIPKVYAANSELPSGLKLIGEPILVKALTSIKESRLSQFLKNLSKPDLFGSSSVQMANIWAERLMVTVLLLASTLLVSGFWLGFDDLLRRVTALLVIACPCALAFATPVTLGNFMRKALKKGIFIRNSSALTELYKIKNIFIDKTGTLTTENLKFKSQNPPAIDIMYQKIILGLESRSVHPVAFAFRGSWSNVTPCEITNLSEKIGCGVRGEWNGSHFEIRSLEESVHSNDYAVGFYKNDQLIAEFYFENELKPEAIHFMQDLKRFKADIFILSGDQRSRVESVAKILNIPEKNIYSEVFPEEKAKIVAQYNPSMMIGDGVNDALAFQQARIGVSVRGAIDNQINLAHVSVANSDLRSVSEFFNLAQSCQSILKRNFILALSYNSIGAGLAIMGYVTPLWAAIAMPISSTIILVSTLLGAKK